MHLVDTRHHHYRYMAPLLVLLNTTIIATGHHYDCHQSPIHLIQDTTTIATSPYRLQHNTNPGHSLDGNSSAKAGRTGGDKGLTY
ncbi:MAG: hypothetical protein J0L67_02805 [Cytophagales bacterium]|nr:hypothetical protein [Cytophagales bacterium]